jgi:PGF-pre-PGF domain-containing protein
MWMRENRQRKSFIQSCLARRLVSIYCVALLLLFSFLPIITVQISGELVSSIGSPEASSDPLGSNVPDVSGDSDDVPAGDDDVSGDDADAPANVDDASTTSNDASATGDDASGDDASDDDNSTGNLATLQIIVGDIFAGTQTEIIMDATRRSCVNFIDFIPRANLTNVSVHITRLDARPIEIQEAPIKNGIVYEYLDLKITENDRYIENMNANIGFKVRDEWIIENDIDRSSMRLMRYHNNEWQELNTTFLDINNTNVSFIAETPGFSTFAVVGSANVMSSDTYAPETANIPFEAIIGIITAIVALLIVVLFKARYIYFGENGTEKKPKKKN